jgi:hypothetical protein
MRFCPCTHRIEDGATNLEEEGGHPPICKEGISDDRIGRRDHRCARLRVVRTPALELVYLWCSLQAASCECCFEAIAGRSK